MLNLIRRNPLSFWGAVLVGVIGFYLDGFVLGPMFIFGTICYNLGGLSSFDMVLFQGADK